MNRSKRAREKANREDIPYRKAFNWIRPRDLEHRIDFISSLPEYGVIELEIGGVIAIEDRDG